ncbi:hypothetical protein ACQKWADRAFT_220212 [Trichoderma austrokoningii]
MATRKASRSQRCRRCSGFLLLLFSLILAPLPHSTTQALSYTRQTVSPPLITPSLSIEHHGRHKPPAFLCLRSRLVDYCPERHVLYKLMILAWMNQHHPGAMTSASDCLFSSPPTMSGGCCEWYWRDAISGLLLVRQEATQTRLLLCVYVLATVR